MASATTAAIIVTTQKENATKNTDATFATSAPSSSSSLVSFSTIDIHEHGVILGDNPGGTTGGPPLSVDWQRVAHFSLSIDDYEAKRAAPRRSLEALLLPERARVAMLKEWGYSAEDIRIQSRPVYLDRARRQATRLQFSNGQHGAFNATIWDFLFNLLTAGCHGKKKQEQTKMEGGDGTAGLDESSERSSFSRLGQAQDIVLKHRPKTKNTVPQKCHMDQSTGSSTVTLETSMGSRSSTL